MKSAVCKRVFGIGKIIAPALVLVFLLSHETPAKAPDPPAPSNAERMLESILRSAPTGIGLVENRVIVLVNDYIPDMTGYSRGELLGKSARIFYPSDEEFDFVGREKYRQIAEKGSGSVETLWQRKDGSIRHVILSSTPLDPSDLSKGVTFTVVDITDRRHAEEALRQSEERFSKAFQSSPAPLVISEIATGRFIDVNDRWVDMLGYSREEQLGRTSREVGIWSDPGERDRIIARLEREHSFKNEPIRFITRSGDDRHALWSAEVITLDGREVLLSLILDETDRRGAEAALSARTRAFLVTLGVFIVLLLGLVVRLVAGLRQLKAATVEHETSRAMLETSMAQSPSGILIADAPDVAIRWANPAALDILGEAGIQPSGELVSLHSRTWRIFLPDGRPYPFEELPLSRAVLKGETTRNVDLIIRHKSGENRLVVVNAAPVRGPDGGITAGIAVLYDITERKKTEDALQESDRRYRELVENANSIILRMDRDGQITFFNEFAQSFFGYRNGEIIGRNVVGTIVPEKDGSGRDLRAMIEDIGANPGRYADNENENMLRDGTRVWITWTNKALLDESGKVKEILCIGKDVTEFRQAQEALKASEERLNLALDAVNDGLWDWRTGSGEAYFSPRWYTMLGYEPYELPGSYETWRKLVHPEDLPNAEKTVLQHLETAEPFELEFRMKAKKGGWVWIFARGKTVETDDKGNAVRMLGTHMDITGHKVMEEQLIQAQKMESVGRLAGGIAHDFNNMLGIILGYTEMAMEFSDPSQPVHSNLQEIRKATMRSADLVSQLLAFARKQTISPKKLALNDTVEGMIKMIRRLIGEDIGLAWMPGRNLWPVRMDPTQIHQILANLCVNARDAMDSAGKLTIETQNVSLGDEFCSQHTDLVPGDYVILAVGDNGCGMEKEVLDKIFDPFFTTKEVGKGTGLGLPTVYGIVKQNSGFIEVQSEPGRGTTFRIHIPRYTGKEDEPPSEDSDQTIPGGNETVLLVEDEPMMLKMGKDMLEKLGYKVLATADPSEAIRTAGEHQGPVHLLVTDVVMPGMNGRELAEKLSESRPGLKQVFMSGYTADIIARHGVMDPGLNYIQKPFSMKDLAVKIRKALQG